MMKWVYGTASFVLIFAIILSWEAERCETARQQCQSAIAAHAPSNPVISLPAADANANQEQYQNQTGGPCADSNSYLCLILTPANLPTILLVLIGFGGIVIAIGTLHVLEKQTEALKRSVELQSVQWVVLKEWRSSHPAPYRLKVEVDVHNETDFPLTIEDFSFRIGTSSSTGLLKITVVPHAHHTLDLNHTLTAEEETAYMTNQTVFGLRGAITFLGVSGRIVQPFGGLISAGSRETFFRPEGAYEQSAKEYYQEPPN